MLQVGRKRKDVGIYRCLANTTNGFALLSRPAVLKIAGTSMFGFIRIRGAAAINFYAYNVGTE